MKTYKTLVVIFSRNGVTPITKRGGSYCDELLRAYIETENPADAQGKVLELIRSTRYGYCGFFDVLEYPNHNTKCSWVNIGTTYKL